MVFAVGAIAVKCLINQNLRLYEAMGFTRFADFWNSQISWYLPLMRLLCATASLGLFGKAIVLY
jgi:hypothetical protein